MSNLTKCSVCGNTYNYCPNCASTHAWKYYTDTHECYQIFIAIKQYKKGLISKEEARRILENLGLTLKSNLDKYKPVVSAKIREILTVDEIVEPPIEEKTILKKNRKSKLYKD